MKIHEILQAIEVYEDILENSMSVDMINNLLALYQQAIEYFAAVSNPQFDVFLKRMHMLLANEDVLNLLQGKEVKNNEKIANKSEDKESLNKLEHKENTNKFEEKDIVDELEEKKTVEREEKNIFEQLEDKTFEVKETIDEQKRPDALETNYFENDKNSEIQTDKIVEKGADNKNFEENEVKRNPDESESKEENTQIIIEEKIVEERTQIIIEENTQIKIDENEKNDKESLEYESKIAKESNFEEMVPVQSLLEEKVVQDENIEILKNENIILKPNHEEKSDLFEI